MLNNKWPKIVLVKILTVKNATEQRNLGTLTNKIKCKWKKNQVTIEELRLGGEQELDLRRFDKL
jgi:hypothetical protein